ncbi:MAG: hypothetical protein AABW89_05120 [Nanoarchaeota archaeon]
MSRHYEEGSLADLAVKGLNPIKDLLDDDRPISRLLALNLILVFISLGIIIAFYLGTKFDNFAGIVMLLVSFLFGAIITGAYAFFVNLISKGYKMKAVRGSIFLLFITIPLAPLGLVYNLKVLINLSLLMIFIQLIFMIVASLLMGEEKVEQEKGIWGILGRTNTVLGLLSSIITILGIFFKFLR